MCLLGPPLLTEEWVDIFIGTVDFRLAPRRKSLCPDTICRCTIHSTRMCPFILVSGAPATLVRAVCGYQTGLIVKIGIT